MTEHQQADVTPSGVTQPQVDQPHLLIVLSMNLAICRAFLRVSDGT
jgi:hypothetical protein